MEKTLTSYIMNVIWIKNEKSNERLKFTIILIIYISDYINYLSLYIVGK